VFAGESFSPLVFSFLPGPARKTIPLGAKPDAHRQRGLAGTLPVSFQGISNGAAIPADRSLASSSTYGLDTTSYVASQPGSILWSDGPLAAEAIGDDPIRPTLTVKTSDALSGHIAHIFLSPRA